MSPAQPPRRVRLVDLGRRPYGEALEVQRGLCRARVAGTLDHDVLLLVEHPAVITLGRGTRDSSLPIAPELLRSRGFEVYEVERGGDVTLHAPGQLVGYPVLQLADYRKDLHWYLRQIEEVLIQGLAAVGVVADRRPGLTGVWTADRKIASIGIHVKQWVTLHGFALNVTTDLGLFDVIVPCGIPDVRMTSVAAETGREADPVGLWESTRGAVEHAFAGVFECALEAGPLPALTP